MKRIVKFFLKKVDRKIILLCSKSRFLAAMYYACINPSFSYEQRAFLQARLKYSASLTCPDGSMALLRRNTHRIE